MYAINQFTTLFRRHNWARNGCGKVKSGYTLYNILPIPYPIYLPEPCHTRPTPRAPICMQLGRLLHYMAPVNPRKSDNKVCMGLRVATSPLQTEHIPTTQPPRLIGCRQGNRWANYHLNEPQNLCNPHLLAPTS